jgi:hypothetical protein
LAGVDLLDSVGGAAVECGVEGWSGMTLQLGALRDAGASPELASKAAEEAAGFETRFGATDKALADLSAQIDNRFAQVESSFAVVNGRIDKLQWMLGVVLASTGAILASTCGILVRLFVPH